MSRIVVVVSLIIFLVLSIGLGEIRESGFVSFISFQLCAWCCLVSVLIPLGIASGLKMGLIATVSSLLFIGKTNGRSWILSLTLS